jgi:hypothetical protein
MKQMVPWTPGHEFVSQPVNKSTQTFKNSFWALCRLMKALGLAAVFETADPILDIFAGEGQDDASRLQLWPPECGHHMKVWPSIVDKNLQYCTAAAWQLLQRKMSSLL